MKKKSNEKVIIILTILLFLALLYFFIKVVAIRFELKNTEETISDNTSNNFEVLNNKNPINIDEMIEKNRNIEIREEMLYEEQDLEYTTEYIYNENLPTGTIHVSQIGITGTQDVITIKRYLGEELISEKIVASNVKKASVNKIVEIGTGRRKKQV